MSRQVSNTISSAVEKTATRPVYLIEMGFATTSRAATWGAAIPYDGKSFVASGIQIGSLSNSGGRMVLPMGDADPWLALVLGEGTRGKTIAIYEHHTDPTASPQTDAVLIFSGYMDAAVITDKITVQLVESSNAKAFPAESVDATVFTHLLTSGDRITWGSNVITVA